MDDMQSAAVEKEVELETTQVESPQTEVETSPQTDKGSATNVEDNLPESVEEQRKAFQQQRLEIKKLKEELESRQKNESAFSTFKQAPSAVQTDQYADPMTGEINWTAYNQAQQQAIRAQAQLAAREELDELQARQRHPELFNDPETEKEMAALWYFSKINGENVSVSQIADRYAKRYQKDLSKAEKSGAEKALQEVAEKEQASLAAPSQSPGRAQREASLRNDEELVTRARYGDDQSLAELMAKVPFANK